MQTFDQSLLMLYKKGLITYEEALLTATNPDDFALKVKGIQSTSDIATEEDENRKTPGIKPGGGIPGKPGGSIPGTIPGSAGAKPSTGVPPRFGGTAPAAPKPQEAREYTGGSGDTDFKIDRFGDK